MPSIPVGVELGLLVMMKLGTSCRRALVKYTVNAVQQAHVEQCKDIASICTAYHSTQHAYF